MKLPEVLPHQKGEPLEPQKKPDYMLTDDSKLAVDTFGGRVHVEWDPQSSVTPLGQLPFFIEFLKLGNLLEPWVEDCPLFLTSPNAPSKRDVLGTLLLSVLAGHKRYAHVTTIRCDNVNPSLLGMNQIVSEDSLRRALLKIAETDTGVVWLQTHLYKCYQPVLDVPWVLDVDTTVKVLYGKQEGAVVGYNPKKPGRPSHAYHTFSIANLRLILDVEVQAGNEMAASYTAPSLWSLLDRIPRTQWPQFIRGDCAFGTDAVMNVAEEKGVPYLFKIKQTKNVKRLIEKLMLNQDWSQAGQGWEGQEGYLQLMGWSKSRRVIVLRKRVAKEYCAIKEDPETKQLSFDFAELDDRKMQIYEYAVLVTSLTDEALAIAYHYRDRADSENVFDELKNQWGWGGFTTQDLGRCQLTARVVGLIYNWWNLFVRLADPGKHLEAITSRPLLLHAVGKQTSHAGQTFIKITSVHGKTPKVKKLLNRIVTFFKALKNAEQLSSEQRWYRILSKALEKYLHGRLLQPPIMIPKPG
jgi:hypothetical protein